MERIALLLGLALLGSAAAAPAGAADPFYDELLTEGQLAYARGDHQGAAKRFRVACFGLLEEPERLAECRTRLALAEAGLGRREEFESAFRQVLELERRFGAYTDAAIPDDVRAAFEEQVARWIPAELVRDVPAFAPALRRRALDRLAELPAAQKRAELEQLAAVEPEEPRWPLELARLTLAERSWLAAQEWAQRALDLAPGEDEARCLRGRAAAMAGRCTEALPDLEACGAAPTDARLVEDQLACHLALQDLDGAEAFIASLPAELQQSRTVRRAAKSVERARQAQARAAAPDLAAAPEDDVEEPGPAERGTAADTRSAAAGEGASDEELRRLRASLLSANDYETLSTLFDRARELAEESPDWVAAQRLAGEAAYRTSQWERGVHFLRRSGLDGAAPPALLFYLAVSLYESGEPEEAALVLQQALPRLEGSPLVDSYRRRILGDGG